MTSPTIMMTGSFRVTPESYHRVRVRITLLSNVLATARTRSEASQTPGSRRLRPAATLNVEDIVLDLSDGRVPPDDVRQSGGADVGEFLAL